MKINIWLTLGLLALYLLGVLVGIAFDIHIENSKWSCITGKQGLNFCVRK